MNPFRHRRLASVVFQMGSGRSDSGLCFHRSAALVLDLPWGDLCIGTLKGATVFQRAADPRVSPTPFIHAWVERGEVLYAPTLIEEHGGLTEIERFEYYRFNAVRDVYRMPRAEVLRLARAEGWLKGEVFAARKDLQSAPLGGVLLRALGVPHRVWDGRVLPLEGAEA